MMLDILGHIAYLFLMTGTYLAARNKPCGWALRAVGSAAWMGLGVSMGLTSIWIWSGIFLVNDISAWSKWRQERQS